jgi:hypothetical protein
VKGASPDRLVWRWTKAPPAPRDFFFLDREEAGRHGDATRGLRPRVDLLDDSLGHALEPSVAVTVFDEPPRWIVRVTESPGL